MKSFLYYFLPSFFFFFGLLSSSRMTSSAIRTLLVFDSSSTGPVDRKNKEADHTQTEKWKDIAEPQWYHLRPKPP